MSIYIYEVFEFSCNMGCPQITSNPTLIPPFVFLMLFFFDNSTSETVFGGQEISVDLLLVAERVKKESNIRKYAKSKNSSS